MTSANHGIPMLTSTSNNFFEFMAKLKMVLLAKGLWHVCDPSATVVSRPVVKIEKGASSAPGYQPPTEYEQSELEFNAAALQNHEVSLLIVNCLDFSLHQLLQPHPEPPLNQLGRTVYLQIDHHFRQSNEWVKQEILAQWENIALTNPRDTYHTIASTYHEGISADLDITPYSAAIKVARLIQPLHAAYIPILMAVMDNTSSTLEGIWPTVVSTGNLLRLTAPPHNEHANNASYPPRPPRGDWPPRGGPRDTCDWYGAPGHHEDQCYSKDPANLLLHPPKAGWPDDIVPDRFKAKYFAPLPRNVQMNRTPCHA
jgi:hypothetical protein